MDESEMSWVSFLGPAFDSNLSDNRSQDVMRKNCFGNFNTTACIRSSLLSGVSGLTALLCIERLWKFHMAVGRKNHHHLALFYVATIHCLTESAEWILGWSTEAALASMYMRSMELLVICHFYLTLTCRVMHCANESTGRIAVLCMSMLFVYFTSFVIIGYVYVESPWIDCYAKYWMFLSTGHLVAVQLLVVTSVVLSRKIDSVSGQESIKRSQKRDLWSLITIFQVSAMGNLAYFVTMFNLANEVTGCSGVFNHQQMCYSFVKVSYEVFIVLMPIWVLWWVFRPTTHIRKAELQSYNSSIGSDGVLLDPTLVPPPNIRNWRHRYRPLNTNRVLQDGGALSYRRSNGRRGMRKTASCPSNLDNKGRSRRQQANGGREDRAIAVISPPPLATIPEESQASASPASSMGASPESPGPSMRVIRVPVAVSVDVHCIRADNGIIESI